MSFGHYSRDRVGHLRLRDQVPAAAVKYERAGHNRIVWEDADGVRYFRLIRSDIVIFDPKSAAYTVDYHGFHTKTT